MFCFKETANNSFTIIVSNGNKNQMYIDFHNIRTMFHQYQTVPELSSILMGSSSLKVPPCLEHLFRLKLSSDLVWNLQFIAKDAGKNGWFSVSVQYVSDSNYYNLSLQELD